MQKTGTKPTPTAAIERHLTVPELSKLLNLDPRAVRRMFPDEPTAARMRTVLQPGRRSHSTLHIPASTALRILRRLTGAGDDGAILAGGNSLPNLPAPEVAA